MTLRIYLTAERHHDMEAQERVEGCWQEFARHSPNPSEVLPGKTRERDGTMYRRLVISVCAALLVTTGAPAQASPNVVGSDVVAAIEELRAAVANSELTTEEVRSAVLALQERIGGADAQAFSDVCYSPWFPQMVCVGSGPGAPQTMIIGVGYTYDNYHWLWIGLCHTGSVIPTPCGFE